MCILVFLPSKILRTVLCLHQCEAVIYGKVIVYAMTNQTIHFNLVTNVPPTTTTTSTTTSTVPPPLTQ